MEKHQFSQITFPRRLAGIAIGVLLCSVAAAGQPAPSLGSADSFVILAGTGVVNSGPTQVTGSIGVSAAMPGSPPVVPSPGSFLSGGSTVGRAQQANTTLYNDLAGRTCTDPLPAFPPVLLPNRVYCISSGALLSGRPLRLAGTSSNDL